MTTRVYTNSTNSDILRRVVLRRYYGSSDHGREARAPQGRVWRKAMVACGSRRGPAARRGAAPAAVVIDVTSLKGRRHVAATTCCGRNGEVQFSITLSPEFSTKVHEARPGPRARTARSHVGRRLRGASRNRIGDRQAAASCPSRRALNRSTSACCTAGVGAGLGCAGLSGGLGCSRLARRERASTRSADIDAVPCRHGPQPRPRPPAPGRHRRPRGR